MRGAAELLQAPKSFFGNIISFFNVSRIYFKRNNPFVATYMNLTYSIRNFLNTSKQFKIQRRRVNHLNYRLNQMEQIIDKNNPYNALNGNNINQIR